MMPDVILLFWYYLVTGVVLLANAGVAWSIWFIRKDAVAGWLAYLLFWTAVNVLARSLSRAPYAMLSPAVLAHAGYITVFGMVVCSFGLLDAYLASHNGHLDVLRRVLYWWRRRREPEEEHYRRYWFRGETS